MSFALGSALVTFGVLVVFTVGYYVPAVRRGFVVAYGSVESGRSMSDRPTCRKLAGFPAAIARASERFTTS